MLIALIPFLLAIFHLIAIIHTLLCKIILIQVVDRIRHLLGLVDGFQLGDIASKRKAGIAMVARRRWEREPWRDRRLFRWFYERLCDWLCWRWRDLLCRW